MADHNDETDALTAQLEEDGLIEQYVEEDGTPALDAILDQFSPDAVGDDSA